MNAFANRYSTPFLTGLFLVSLISAAIFVVPSIIGNGADGGGNPAFRAITVLSDLPVTKLAVVLDVTPDDLVRTLQDRGLAVTSTDQNLREISIANGTDSRELVIWLLPGGK
ncbi:hypothetical protein [Thalassospira sp. CH_XMU1448-2]|uniref:hypothetical protein n=1 Tax=Thalassospira sp. CH_XMU1448-2 TaxID=3107773 RepID=UPI0030096974